MEIQHNSLEIHQVRRVEHTAARDVLSGSGMKGTENVF